MHMQPRDARRGMRWPVFVRLALALALCFGGVPAIALSAYGSQAFAAASAQSDDDDANRAAEEEAARIAAEEEARRQAEEEAARIAAEEEARRQAEEEAARIAAEEEARRQAEEEAARIAAEEEARRQAEEEAARQQQEQQQASGGSANPDAPTIVALHLFYENYSDPRKPIAYNPKSNPQITQDKGTMALYAKSESSTGITDWTDDTGVGVVWSIVETLDESGAASSSAIAEVDRADGTVRALGQGNGSVVVRCQAQNYDAYADIRVSIKGNSDVPYLTDLQICSEDGAVYDNDAEIRIESKDFGLEKKFFARATYHDPKTGGDVVRDTRNGDEVPGIVWKVSGDAKVSFVNPDTGVFIAKATGSVRLTCQVAGGGLLGDTISDYVFVLCGGDTLDPDRDYSPASELKVVVKYATEDKQGIGGESDYEEARTWYYSPSELESLGVTENLYTLVKSDGNWGTMKARGVYFERLISNVINAPEFSLSMVKGFYFGAVDNYNPGFVGEAWLFETQRYYYPNMSIGSGRAGAVPVAPMIATATVQEDLIDEPSGALSDQTRFRLCMGAESTTNNNAQQSIYNIYQITIILNGAPPVGWDEPSTGHGATSGSGNGGGNGSGAGDGSGQGSGDGTGAGGADNSGSSPDGGSQAGNTPVPGAKSKDDGSNDSGKKDDSTGENKENPRESADGAESRDAQPNAEAAQATGANVAAADQTVETKAEATEQTEKAIEEMVGDKDHRYQVYEMMSRQPDLVEALQLENPLAPFVVPGLLLVVLAGGAHSTLWFRRQLRPEKPEAPSGNAGGRLIAALTTALRT